VGEVVRTTAEGFRPLTERNGLQLIVHAPSESAADVMIDPDRMAQVLANLIENAVTFARSSITVALSDPDPSAPSAARTITVQDDGPGIAPGDLGRVFDRFYQADHGRSRQVGSGLGLAIVAELVTAMGANVRAESPVSVDGGARFTVTIPGATSTADVATGLAPALGEAR
jgi:signal transduction histidine kinase